VSTPTTHGHQASTLDEFISALRALLADDIRGYATQLSGARSRVRMPSVPVDPPTVFPADIDALNDLEQVLAIVQSGLIEVPEVARRVTDQAQAERQAIEERRSIHRNRNRAFTLVGALLISLVLTWMFQHPLPTRTSPTRSPRMRLS
jgi:hypothetical protein